MSGVEFEALMNRDLCVEAWDSIGSIGQHSWHVVVFLNGEQTSFCLV